MIQKLKAALDADDRAVSPVIGVILMVAITVILAAVIASLTLGLGDSAQTAPTAKFDFEQDAPATDSTAVVSISHASGANIDDARLEVFVAGDGEDDSVAQFTPGDDVVGAGDFVDVSVGSYSAGDKVTVVWTSEDGSTSSTLATYTVQ